MTDPGAPSRPDIGPVVPSAHLADSALPAWSGVAFALAMTTHAFHGWMVRGRIAAGGRVVSPLGGLVLRRVHHRGRPGTLAEMRLTLDIGATRLVNHAIRKPKQAKLLKAGRKGRERNVQVTEAGAALCGRDRQGREALFVRAARQIGHAPHDMSRVGSLLRALSGGWDQATRAAAAR